MTLHGSVSGRLPCSHHRRRPRFRPGAVSGCAPARWYGRRSRVLDRVRHRIEAVLVDLRVDNHHGMRSSTAGGRGPSVPGGRPVPLLRGQDTGGARSCASRGRRTTADQRMRSVIASSRARRSGFRTLSKMTAGQRDTALCAGTIALLLNEWIEARFDLSKAERPARDAEPGGLSRACVLRVAFQR